MKKLKFRILIKLHGEKRTRRARVRRKKNLPARGPLVFTRALLVKHKRRAREERAEDSQSSCACELTRRALVSRNPSQNDHAPGAC